MFYFITSKFVGSLKYILIIGTICYIILHAYLFGPNASDTTEKSRHYLYYLFLLDATLTGAYIWASGGKSKHDIIEEEEDDEDEYSKDSPKQTDNNIEDVHRTLLELKAQQELKLKDNSPFVKKKPEKDNKSVSVSLPSQDDTDIPLYSS